MSARSSTLVKTPMTIAEVSQLSGLSQDTLRWYEREGLIPRVARSGNGRRHFSNRITQVILLLVKLRETGMPTADMREFVRLLDQGPASHEQRLALLERHHQRLDQAQCRLDEARAALTAKTAHYRALIAAGSDCLATADEGDQHAHS